MFNPLLSERTVMSTQIKTILALVLCVVLCLPVYVAGAGDTDVISVPVNDYIKDFAGLASEMRDRMIERQTKIILYYACSSTIEENFFKDLFDNVFEHTGDPRGGDYLLNHYSGYNCSYGGFKRDGVCYYTLNFDMKYHTDAKQENAVDTEVEKIARKIKNSFTTDYEKIVAIYRFVTNNTEYDYTNLNDKNYALKYSAYAALINKTSVCQGYANLMYRLCLELGIDCRIISGIGIGGPHTWNIIRGHDGRYYLFDATWDASNIRNGLSHSYCFNGSDDFDGHFAYEKFLTDEFTAKYPIAKEHHKFEPSNHVFDDVWHIDAYATDAVSGEKSHHCTICGTRGEVFAVPYFHAEDLYRNFELKSWSRDGIDFVSSNGLMGDIGNGDFSQTGKMTRSMFVTVLYRMAGSPKVSEKSPFTDLDPAQSWYHDAVTWAFKNGIVTGTSATTFSPDAEVTREQIATLLYRYTVNYLKTRISNIENDISSFPDESSVADYAREALNWANGIGLIKGQSSGSTSILAPKNDATREEVAVVIFRFCMS